MRVRDMSKLEKNVMCGRCGKIHPPSKPCEKYTRKITKSMGEWATFKITYVHVVPINDIREHNLGVACACIPRLESHLIIHNAFDLREKFEGFEIRVPTQ